jgi:hypothetical protein
MNTLFAVEEDDVRRGRYDRRRKMCWQGRGSGIVLDVWEA